jgi:hypothetical protein
VPAATSFVDRLQPYVAEWSSAAHEQNVVTEHRLHDGTAWVAYLQWYLPRTLSHLIFQRKPNASHMCARIKFTHI